MVVKLGIQPQLGVLQRLKGQTALQRWAYQTAGVAVDLREIRRSFENKAGEHRAQWILLPDGAPAWDAQVLWTEAGKAERYYTAQEARTLDIPWPRVMPFALVGEAVHEIFLLFKESGLPCEVDLNVCRARDGGENPHLHAIIAMRTLGPEGFSRTKARGWNQWFRSEGGRRAARHVAEALTAVAKRHNLPFEFDHRSNAERGLPPPEDPLARSIRRRPDTQLGQLRLAEQAQQRDLRAKWDVLAAAARDIDDQIRALDAEQKKLFATLPRLEPDRPEARWSPLLRAEWTEALADLPFACSIIGLAEGSLAVEIESGTLLVDTGPCLLVDGDLDNDVALVLLQAARAKGWRRTSLRVPQSVPEHADRERSLVPLWWGRRIESARSPEDERGRKTEFIGFGYHPSARAQQGFRLLAAAHTGPDSPAKEKVRANLSERPCCDMAALIQRSAILDLGCVPAPDQLALGNLMMATSVSEVPEANLWEVWKAGLELELLAVKSLRTDVPRIDLDDSAALDDDLSREALCNRLLEIFPESLSRL